MKDAHGDRMKSYERQYESHLNPHLPVYVRIDGRSFSKFTKNMERPFDINMHCAMVYVAENILTRTNACCAYTQSDEISLVYLAEDENSDIIFGGRLMKLVSVLASMAASLFVEYIQERENWQNYINRTPHFDCRVCQLPNKTEAANMFLWRYKDATRNAVSMLAQNNFSHKQLQNKSTQEMISMLSDFNIKLTDYHDAFYHGTFIKKENEYRYLTDIELEKIPLNLQPQGLVERHKINYYYFNFMECKNRESFIFGNI